jgi:replicative DNA helicase
VRLKALAALERTRAALEAAADDDALTEALGALNSNIASAGSSLSQSSWVDTTSAVRGALASIEEDMRLIEAGGIVGLPTSISGLDELLGGGLRDGDLVVVAARPGMGKTAICLDMALQVAQHTIWDSPDEWHCGRVGIVSREMPATQLAERCFSKLSGVPYSSHIRQRRMSRHQWAQVRAAADAYRAMDIHVEEKANTAAKVDAAARRLHATRGLDLLIVDYAQRVGGRSDKTHEQLGEVATTCKTLALSLRIPVVLLSQFNRDADGREPQASMLKGSGDLEQEADFIIAPYRPFLHNPEVAGEDEALILCLKGRHGGLGARIQAHFHGPTMTFSDPPSDLASRYSGRQQ